MTASDRTPEERVRRVKAALAEAGYPSASAYWLAEAECPHVIVGPGLPGDPPLTMAWRAMALAGEDGMPCWPCADVGIYDGNRCDHDPLTSEWPPVPSPSDNKEQRA